VRNCGSQTATSMPNGGNHNQKTWNDG